jgi:uncharacterized Fe-S cluster-containing MiaB family protein
LGSSEAYELKGEIVAKGIKPLLGGYACISKDGFSMVLLIKHLKTLSGRNNIWKRFLPVMNEYPGLKTSNQLIISRRGKNSVDPYKPYAWLVEKERTASGKIKDTAIIFLTNKECPYHCLMCDLWKNTTDETVPVGAIPSQIEWALKQLPSAQHLKLYNSGSFFDPKAIPEEDYRSIAELIGHFETVIVVSHPRLINGRCLKFRDMLIPELQVWV